MRLSSRWLVALLMLGLATLAPMGCQKEVEAGPAAPGFQLRDTDGESVGLDEFRGRVVLLDFWATWCPPCRMSIPELVSLQSKYGQKGLVVLGISLDDPAQANDKFLQAFKEKSKINYKILRYSPEVVEAYFRGTSPAIPTMFLIDREGKIREKFVGFMPGAVEKSLKQIFF